MSTVSVESALRGILESTIGKRAMPARLTDDTALLQGHSRVGLHGCPGILTQIQDDFGVPIDDDEVSADIFQTFGDLRRFVESKLG